MPEMASALQAHHGKVKNEFPWVNNGLGQSTREIMRELRESAAAQLCPLEVSSPIR
jgi:hypothetical protein